MNFWKSFEHFKNVLKVYCNVDWHLSFQRCVNILPGSHFISIFFQRFNNVAKRLSVFSQFFETLNAHWVTHHPGWKIWYKQSRPSAGIWGTISFTSFSTPMVLWYISQSYQVGTGFCINWVGMVDWKRLQSGTMRSVLSNTGSSVDQGSEPHYTYQRFIQEARNITLKWQSAWLIYCTCLINLIFFLVN